ncbi:MAG TPA: tRNA adenosine deaminase-associated protein [Jiangellaceae bacterium]|nr:tRNA adenosine deaminase-associated protein [Jiangellaceae bacterium]
MAEDSDLAVDFVVVAYTEDGVWQVESMPPVLAGDLQGLLDVLRQRPGDYGAIGLVSIDDDFFVIVRAAGGRTQLFLSDITAANDWPMARNVLNELGLPMPEDDEDVQPAGEVDLLADYGLPPFALAAICDDLDAYPDEMLADVASTLGFGDMFDVVISTTTA